MEIYLHQDVSEALKKGDLLISEKVYTCSPQDLVLQVTKEMAQRNIGCVVVTEGKIPIGIFTERDLLKKVVAAELKLEETLIYHVMTPNPVCISLSTPISRVFSAMRLGRFRHLVVVNEKKELTGVISIKDIFNCISDKI